jgi:hypothetical protein
MRLPIPQQGDLGEICVDSVVEGLVGRHPRESQVPGQHDKGCIVSGAIVSGGDLEGAFQLWPSGFYVERKSQQSVKTKTRLIQREQTLSVLFPDCVRDFGNHQVENDQAMAAPCHVSQNLKRLRCVGFRQNSFRHNAAIDDGVKYHASGPQQ